MERLISSPWFAGGLAIALAVYSKRQDVKGEHIALLVAGLFGAIAVFQAVPESLPFALRGLWTTLGGSIIGLVLYYVFWTPAVSSVPVPSQQIQSAGPSEVEKQERRQLRNQIGELIQRGRIFQANLLKIGQRQIPNPRPVVASLVRDSMQWHLQVVQLAEVNFGHAE